MANKYEYKVEYFNTNVSQADVDSGEAGNKVASQMELKMQEMSGNGFEYYGRTTSNVKIEAGCSMGGNNNQPSNVTIPINVFRKEK